MRKKLVYNVWKLNYLTISYTALCDMELYDAMAYGIHPSYDDETYVVTSFRIMI